jgi:hypothetical protein
VTEANPFRQAARRIWLAAEAPDLEPEERIPLHHIPHPADWNPNDAGAATLERIVHALRHRPP